jgi:hypothetical protein
MNVTAHFCLPTNLWCLQYGVLFALTRQYLLERQVALRPGFTGTLIESPRIHCLYHPCEMLMSVEGLSLHLLMRCVNPCGQSSFRFLDAAEAGTFDTGKRGEMVSAPPSRARR